MKPQRTTQLGHGFLPQRRHGGFAHAPGSLAWHGEQASLVDHSVVDNPLISNSSMVTQWSIHGSSKVNQWLISSMVHRLINGWSMVVKQWLLVVNQWLSCHSFLGSQWWTVGGPKGTAPCDVLGVSLVHGDSLKNPALQVESESIEWNEALQSFRISITSYAFVSTGKTSGRAKECKGHTVTPMSPTFLRLIESCWSSISASKELSW